MKHETQDETYNAAEGGAELDAALEQALEEQPRAAELRQMKARLQERHATLIRELDVAEDEATRQKLRRDLAKLEEQIRVLGEEAEITKFVEDAVRVGLEMRRLSSG